MFFHRVFRASAISVNSNTNLRTQNFSINFLIDTMMEKCARFLIYALCEHIPPKSLLYLIETKNLYTTHTHTHNSLSVRYKRKKKKTICILLYYNNSKYRWHDIDSPFFHLFFDRISTISCIPFCFV